jgi:hypothetical protein
MSDAPSAFRIEQTLSAWQAARDHLLRSDESLANDEAALIDALGPEEQDVHAILARLLRATVHARDMAAAADERAKAINARRDRYRARAEHMTNAALAILQITGERRVETGDLTASIRRNPDSVVITDPDAVPDMLCRIVTTRAPDKAEIAKWLKSGADVPGATLNNGGESLQIRTN